MNSPEPFIPAWAEEALGPKPTAHAMVEIALYKEFYEAWELFMAIPTDKVYKHKRDAAAGVLREKALTLRALRKTNG